MFRHGHIFFCYLLRIPACPFYDCSALVLCNPKLHKRTIQDCICCPHGSDSRGPRPHCLYFYAYFCMQLKSVHTDEERTRLRIHTCKLRLSQQSQLQQAGDAIKRCKLFPTRRRRDPAASRAERRQLDAITDAVLHKIPTLCHRCGGERPDGFAIFTQQATPTSCKSSTISCR